MSIRHVKSGKLSFIKATLLLCMVLVVSRVAFAQPNSPAEEPVTEEAEEVYDYGDFEYDDDSEDINSYDHYLKPDFATDFPVNQAPISAESREEIIAGRVYEREKIPDIEVNDSWNFNTDFLSNLSTLAWVLVVMLLLFVLGFLIYKSQQVADTDVTSVSFGINDQLLAVSRDELENLLASHLDSGDYREAIRYRFGTILQKMRDKQVLRWVPGKTNEDYLHESPEALKPTFGVLAKAFSFAFYGGRKVMRAQYDQFEQLALATEDTLQTLHRKNTPGA